MSGRIKYSKAPTYEPSSCKLSKMRMSVCMSNHTHQFMCLVYIVKCASSTVLCSCIFYSTVVPYHYFKPRISRNKHKSSSDIAGSVQFSDSVMSDSLQPHGLQHSRLPCPSPTPRACSNSCPSSQRCHPTISSSVIPFSSCLQFLPASGSFPKSQFFASGGQNIGVSTSTSVLSMNIQDWFPLGLTGWISLQSKGLPGVFSNTTVQKYPFFGTQLSL